MPCNDRTGPMGDGPKTGRGTGPCGGGKGRGAGQGMGRGAGRGMGQGMGRGAGRGMGLGLGRRAGHGRSWQTSQETDSDPLTTNDDSAKLDSAAESAKK